MYKIVCDFCGREIEFKSMEDKPAECPNPACQSALDGLEIKEVKDTPETTKENITEIKLIYQKTSEEISFSTNSKIILGRESHGQEVLGRIPQVSRNHCSIECKEGKIIVTDLNSTNGTFLGLGSEQVNCSTPQKLKENDFLVLGKEVFLVQFVFETQLENIIEEVVNEPEKPKEILCSECSCVLDKLPCSCPDCGAWNE